MTANLDFFDAQVRHQIGIQRLTAGDVKRTLALLKESEIEISNMLSSRLKKGDFTSQRYKKLLADVRALRRSTIRSVAQSNRSDLRAMAKAEQGIMKNMLEQTIPVRLDFAVADPARLAAALNNPFTAGTNAAKSLSQWWNNLATVDGNRILQSVQLGMVQGETISQMVKRVTDVVAMTANNAEAVVRTASNHISTQARDAFFQANADVIGSLMWSAQLDGRTTVICASRDGHYAPVDGVTWKDVPDPHLDSPTVRPPAHVRCRSFMVATLDADGIAQKMPDRAFVRDKRTRKMREKDFRADAKAKAGAKNWKEMTPKQRNASVRGERELWAKNSIGQAPGKMNYEQWLKKQPPKFQDEVLGKAKGQLFRKGTPIGKFVDKKGSELTLKEFKTGSITPSRKPTWTSAKQKAWEDSLSVAERATFSRWTSNDYHVMRMADMGVHQLGKKKLDDFAFDMWSIQSKRLNAALDKAPIFNSGKKLYRGMSLSPEAFKTLTTSEAFVNNAIASSSSDLGIARAFTKAEHGVMNARRVVLTVENNRSGVNIASLSSRPEEFEVVLRRGAKYRVKKTVYHSSESVGGITHPEWWEVLLEEI